MDKLRKTKTGRLLTGLLISGAVWLYLWAAWQQAVRVNTDMDRTDQKAYMSYAKNLARTHFHFVGGRNRMPAYPALMAFFYKPGLPDEIFFERGKKVGIGLGLFCLFLVFLVFNCVASLLDALTGTLVAMFSVFVYKAPYFQAELLFYTVGFLLFCLLLTLVKTPGLKKAALSGLLAGAGFLTKASVQPAMVIAATILFVNGVADLAGRAGATNGRMFRGRRFFCIAVFLAFFLMVVFPYLRTSKERFGAYFYNVNTTFYMWYDSWAEAKEGTRAHGDRKGWPDLPADRIPSFHKYLKEHSLTEIFGRLSRGFGLVAKSARPYAEILLWYVFFISLLIFHNRKHLLKTIRQGNPATFLFVAGFFGTYLLLYAWYAPIASGSRFVLSLYLPALFLLVWFVAYAGKQNLSYVFFGRKISASVTSPLILVFLCLHVLTVLPYRIFCFYGGS